MTYVNRKQKLSKRWASLAETPHSVTLRSPPVPPCCLCDEMQPGVSRLKAPSIPPLLLTISMMTSSCSQNAPHSPLSPASASVAPLPENPSSGFFTHPCPPLFTQKVALQHHLPLKPYLVSPGSVQISFQWVPVEPCTPALMTMITLL